MAKRNYRGFKDIKKGARELRREMTDAERIMWSYLRNRRLEGFKFLRQHPIIYKADFKGLNYFYADFYCHEKRLVIELDGEIHDTTLEYDQFRDDILREMGITVVRFRNEELDDAERVLLKIRSLLTTGNFSVY